MGEWGIRVTGRRGGWVGQGPRLVADPADATRWPSNVEAAEALFAMRARLLPLVGVATVIVQRVTGGGQ